ncbi:MAG: aldehyde dehydrogenase family protein [Proteobacteria bacterium]|nr:aldehyde dehydrogenase family protein [Pseudomonadota bacterium]
MNDPANNEKKSPKEAQLKIQVKSPLDGSLVGEVPAFSIEEARQKLAEVRQAQRVWAKTSFSQRRRIMYKFLKHLVRRSDELAELISRETGKTLYEANVFEIMPLIRLTSYFANRTGKILQKKRISISIFKNRASYLHYRPRGAVLIIAPWNFPLTIPGGEAIMSLMAGNGVLLKPASLTPLIAYKLREIFDEAGLDKKLFQIVSGPGVIASGLIESGVDYVNFTGSTAVGKKVSELCGRKLTPCSMELGGKAPAIICEDADLEYTSKSIVWGAFANSGQICASVERVYVPDNIYDSFLEKVLNHARTIRQGNPLKGERDMGAMTDPRQLEILEEMIAEAREKGAKIPLGGHRSSLGKMFFEPTVIADADESMRVGCEESFGPLLTVMKVKNEDEAIRRANDSRYGLIAYVYSANSSQARKIAERLEAGTVMINEVLMSHAFPETPWQGVKESGVGRVHSDDGLRDLTYPYHVNYEVIPLRAPVGYPYSNNKAKLLVKTMARINRGGLGKIIDILLG